MENGKLKIENGKLKKENLHVSENSCTFAVLNEKESLYEYKRKDK